MDKTKPRIEIKSNICYNCANINSRLPDPGVLRMNQEMEDFVIDGDRDNALDIRRLGGKGYNLLKLRSAGINVPDFMVLSSDAFEYLLRYNNLKKERTLAEHLYRGNIDFPKDLREEILDSFNKKFVSDKVAVRSSATIEDSEKSSMAGQFETVLSVSSENILDAIMRVYASFFKNFNGNENDSMAVVIQKQIYSKKAGVAFVDGNRVIINTVLGQGNILVSGQESGDMYLVNNDGSYKASIKTQSVIDDGFYKGDVPLMVGSKQKLSTTEIKELSKVSKDIFDKFESPQDIEWCIDGGVVYIVQTRPVTRAVNTEFMDASGSIIPVSRGIASGPAWFEKSAIPDHDVILVTQFIELPDFNAIIKNPHIRGLITEFGGMLSHEGILAREMGIPYFAGFKNPRILFKDKKHIVINTEKMSVIADGVEMVNRNVDSYNWLDKSIDGNIHVAICDGDGTVVRAVNDYLIIYYDVKSDKDIDKISKSLTRQGVPIDNKYIVTDKFNSMNIGNGYRHMLVTMNKNPEVKKLLFDVIESVNGFDSKGFTEKYGKIKSLSLKFLYEFEKAYPIYKESKDMVAIADAFESMVNALGCYRAIRNISIYIDYVIGKRISDMEGRILTDAEVYRLKDKYMEMLPEMRNMVVSVENAMADIDDSVHAGSKNEDSLIVMCVNTIKYMTDTVGEMETVRMLFNTSGDM